MVIGKDQMHRQLIADVPARGAADQQLVKFAQEFLRIDDDFASASSDAPCNIEIKDQLVDAQSEIIEKALDIKATDIHGVLAKMSIWLADAPDLSAREDISRYDAIMLSAFSDLAKLCARDNG